MASTAVVLPEACLRPLSRSKDDKGDEAWGEMGDWTGVVSGEEEAEREVLSLVVRVRKMGILSVYTCMCMCMCGVFKLLLLLLLGWRCCYCRNDGSRCMCGACVHVLKLVACVYVCMRMRVKGVGGCWDIGGSLYVSGIILTEGI